ncbi:MAG: CDGSH iron-sulfur domain-containing protein [Rhodothermales bacterium]
MPRNPILEFEGKERKVTWDGRLCIHASECVRANSPLFEYGRKPWGQPDLVAVDDVDEIVRRCPSGALATMDKNGTIQESPAPENTVTVAPNGPLYVEGELDVAGAQPDMPGVAYRAALCRCGQSKNKPFCDNSHKEIAFDDPGAVGECGPGLESLGGPLKVTPSRNGPLLVQGNLAIRAASGKIRWKGTKTALCRCGNSKNKPFCDGSHRDAGFEAEDFS